MTQHFLIRLGAEAIIISGRKTKFRFCRKTNNIWNIIKLLISSKSRAFNF